MSCVSHRLPHAGGAGVGADEGGARARAIHGYRSAAATPMRSSAKVVAETHEPGLSTAAAARRHGINANVVFAGLRDPQFGGKALPVEFVPVATSATPMALPGPEKRPDPLDLTVEFPGGVRIHCRDEPSLIIVRRAARRT